MDRVTLSCQTCERLWTVPCALSQPERQALEAKPCPHCGAAALACHDDAPRPPAAAAWGWQLQSF